MERYALLEWLFFRLLGDKAPFWQQNLQGDVLDCDEETSRIQWTVTSFTNASPIPKICTTNFSLKNWSANIGQVTIGTPEQVASSVEFQPQCVRNTPIAWCECIKTCGAQPWIKSPLPFVLSPNPSSDNHFFASPVPSSSLITKMNGQLHSSNAKASS